MSDSEWFQEVLVTPEVREVNIRIGVVPSQDHVQVLAEMKDPMNGVLLAQWSRPHAPMRDVERAIADATARAVAWIEDASEPF